MRIIDIHEARRRAEARTAFVPPDHLADEAATAIDMIQGNPESPVALYEASIIFAAVATALVDAAVDIAINDPLIQPVYTPPPDVGFRE